MIRELFQGYKLVVGIREDSEIIEVEEDKPLKIVVSPGHNYCLACFFTAKTVKEVVDHDCPGPVDELKFSALEIFEPERFDAFCSLDTIKEHLKTLTTLDKEVLIDDYIRHINCIYGEVHALRAYITGVQES